MKEKDVPNEREGLVAVVLAAKVPPENGIRARWERP